jgi:hypothetical protein
MLCLALISWTPGERTRLPGVRKRRFGGAEGPRPRGGQAVLERDQTDPRFFDTLQSRYGDGRFRRVGVYVRAPGPPRSALYRSPREEATWKHEAETRRGETLGGEKAKRGSAVGSRVTPAQRVRTYRMHQSLELRLGVSASRETA